MKKIAIVTRRMIAGGIEKALISMLEYIPGDEYEVTLWVMGKGGEFEEYIPKWVNVKCLYGDENSTIEKVVNCIKRGNIIRMFKVIFYMFLARRANPGYEEEKYLSKIMEPVEEHYDLAIAYHVPASFPVIYVMDYLKAKKKAAWIHSDVEQYKENLKPYISYYEKYDKIFCVSKYALEKFNTIYPEFSSKTEVFYNIIDKEKLYAMSTWESTFKDNFHGLRILTVGRLTLQKGYDLIPNIVLKLKNEGYNIRWYCIGDGELRKELEGSIDKSNLRDDLILLGTQTNPYPYFKDCDAYVQPSRHEGYCITLAEAKVFNKPIVTTDFVGAREQVTHGETGIITSFNEEELYNSIKNIIINSNLRESFTENLKKKSEKTKINIIKIFNLVK